MLTKAFWAAAAERMLKGAATGLVLSGVSAEPFDLFRWDWRVGLGYILGGALASLVWSILSVKIGPTGSPSLVRDPAAANPTAAATLTGPNQPTTRTNGGTGSNVRMVAREDVRQQFDRGGFEYPGTRLYRNDSDEPERVERPKTGGYPGGDVAPPD